MIAHSLVIVSHVTHYAWQGQLYAYGPYGREVDIWADLFADVRIAAPLRQTMPPGDALPFTRSNIRVIPQLETGGVTLGAKLRQIRALPRLSWSLIRAMKGSDVVHVRCPGNLGLLGALLAPLVARRRIAKYAGQWGAFPGEAPTVKLQRAILRSRWWGAPVTVYGQWPGQPPHVISFFTSITSVEQMEQARRAAARRQLGQPAELLYVGRLSASKRVDVLLRALRQLQQRQFDVRLAIIGDGPEAAVLKRLTRELELEERVRFVGALPFEQVLEHYERAHLLALVSETEGWPKAIAEAMAFGLVCVGADRGAVPWLLGEGRGLTVPVGDPKALADTLAQLVADPERYAAISYKAAQWAQQFTLEGLREALRQLMEQWWHPAEPSPERP